MSSETKDAAYYVAQAHMVEVGSTMRLLNTERAVELSKLNDVADQLKLAWDHRDLARVVELAESYEALLVDYAEGIDAAKDDFQPDASADELTAEEYTDGLAQLVGSTPSGDASAATDVDIHMNTMAEAAEHCCHCVEVLKSDILTEVGVAEQAARTASDVHGWLVNKAKETDGVPSMADYRTCLDQLIEARDSLCSLATLLGKTDSKFADATCGLDMYVSALQRPAMASK